MTHQAEQCKKLSTFILAASFAAIAEMSGGADPANTLVRISVGNFAASMCIAAYLYLAIEFDAGFADFPYRQPDAAWWELKVGAVLGMIGLSSFALGIGFLLAYFHPMFLVAYGALPFVLAAALAEGVIRQKRKRDRK